MSKIIYLPTSPASGFLALFIDSIFLNGIKEFMQSVENIVNTPKKNVNNINFFYLHSVSCSWQSSDVAGVVSCVWWAPCGPVVISSLFYTAKGSELLSQRGSETAVSHYSNWLILTWQSRCDPEKRKTENMMRHKSKARSHSLWWSSSW